MAKVFIIFAATLALSAAAPAQNLPVLKEAPAEVLFRVPGDQAHPLVLECATATPSDNVQYSWQKNGKPFDLKSNPEVTQRKGEGSLIFNKPKDSDAGLYQCFASSDNGVASTRVISVKKTFIEVPKFTVQKHKPEEGKPFQLECSVPNAYPKPRFTWIKQHVTDKSKVDNLMIKRLLESPEGPLTFSNVSKEDVSTDYKYVCLAITPASDEKVVAAEHFIEGLTQPKQPQNGELTEQYLSKDLTSKVGDVTEIYCIYGGTPLAHPDWFKLVAGSRKDMNGDPKDRITRYNRSAGRRLLIKKTLKEDEGTYECVVDNGVGKPQSHKIKLVVEDTAEFVKKPEPLVVAKEGQDVTIPCQISGVEPSKVTWTLNGKPLQREIPQKDNKGVTIADFSLKKLAKKDNGYYGCKGVDKHGEVYAETLVHVA